MRVVSPIPRGGRRAATPGKTYSNRTDLVGTSKAPDGQVIQPGHPLPITVATGQEYGQATAQANAQRAVPMSSGPALPAPASSMQPSGETQTPDHSRLGQLLAGANMSIRAGDIPPLHAPTDRPDEHVMTGLPTGGGAGPEAFGPPPPPTPDGSSPISTSAFLANLASQTGAPSEIVALAQIAQRHG